MAEVSGYECDALSITVSFFDGSKIEFVNFLIVCYCGDCSNWSITMHEGHNLGFCKISKLLTSRFTRACKDFDYTPNNPSEAIYGKEYRSEPSKPSIYT